MVGEDGRVVLPCRSEEQFTIDVLNADLQLVLTDTSFPHLVQEPLVPEVSVPEPASLTVPATPSEQAPVVVDVGSSSVPSNEAVMGVEGSSLMTNDGQQAIFNPAIVVAPGPSSPGLNLIHSAAVSK